MVRPLDVILGSVVGLLLGGSFRRTFELAWNRGFQVLGPLRPSELHPRPGDVPGRTVLRDMIASLFALVAFAITWLLPVFLARPWVDEWRHFVYAWFVSFAISASFVAIRHGRDTT